MKKIAIVNANSFAKYLPEFIDELREKVGNVERFTFDKNITSIELASMLKDYSYVIVGTTPNFDEEFFKEVSNLKYIARFGIGYNNIDIKSAKENNVIVSNIPGYLERYDVAEHAVSLLLALAKHVCDGDIAARDGEWNIKRERFIGTRINCKKIGILGFGNIGATFANIMKKGFDCEILAYDPYLSDNQIRIKGGKKVELDELLKESDVLSLHMSLNKETYHLLDEKKLRKMKKSAIIVNTARGELVDENAIAKILNEDKLAAYGADVIEDEPIRKNNPLLFAKHVVITPHLSTYNIECNEQMCRAVVDDVIRVNNGEEPYSYVNK